MSVIYKLVNEVSLYFAADIVDGLQDLLVLTTGINDGSQDRSLLLEEDTFEVSVEDFGKGIKDISKAMEPLYTTRRDLERSGMGFVFMEAFMDSIHVTSKVGEGTKVTMKKKIGRRYEKQD